MDKNQTKENKMGVMPVGRLLVNMSLPMMASMLVMALYNIVDSMFVARVSENALTALSMAFPVQNLMIALSAGLGVGLNAVLSRALGAKDAKSVSKAASNGLFLMLLCAAALLASLRGEGVGVYLTMGGLCLLSVAYSIWRLRSLMKSDENGNEG